MQLNVQTNEERRGKGKDAKAILKKKKYFDQVPCLGTTSRSAFEAAISIFYDGYNNGVKLSSR